MSNLIYFSILNVAVIIIRKSGRFLLPFCGSTLSPLAFARRGKVAWWSLLGALAFLLNMLMSASIVWLVWQGLLKVYPQYGTVVDTHNGFFYWLAFIILTLAITTAAYNLFRRHLRLADLALGALLWWVIPTVVVSLMMPGVSYWLEWPLLFSLIGLGLLWFLPEQESTSWRRVVLLAAAALPALLLFAWSIYAFYLTLGTDLIIVPVLVMGLMLGLFIPHLDLFARPYRWALPVTAGLVTVAALIAGSLTVGPDAINPQADSIFYALDADTGQALWISEDQPDV
jgi:DMSO/TMAO reductase YedYZ heme-binding membrane subunit